jgi:diguanylate cyclase (GGDEF)-like protein
MPSPNEPTKWSVLGTPAQPLISPRDRHLASRVVAYLMLAGAGFVGILSVLVPGYGGPSVQSNAATYCTGILLAIGGWFCLRRPTRIPDSFWAWVPIGAVALIGGLNLVTEDVSAGGQLFFLWPVLYAATFLHRRLLYLVLAAVFVAEVVLVFRLEPAALAAADTAGLMTALTMASIIIVTLRKRVDSLLGVLETQALEDDLTGLFNRRAFDRDISHAVARARRTGEPLSLLTVDVDHFKSINDACGHAGGDQALQAVATALREVARGSDVIARIGGDEFVALLVDCDVAGATRVANALRTTLARTRGLPGGSPTLSIGAATLPYDADTVDGLAAASDAAMYEAKLSGRDRVVAASETRRSSTGEADPTMQP